MLNRSPRFLLTSIFRSIATRMVSSQAVLSSCVKGQVDNVIKSTEDKRLYRGYELNNGLKILLISDPETDKSAASLDVATGSMNDPKEVPGLAHFCEHMLFMGTKKYPVENDYDNFLATHGGYSNAYTDNDHTNYHFDIAPEHLNGAIDRFAQFFISPLFKVDSSEREVMAVDSEFCNSLQNDAFRFSELEHCLAKEAHDYRKFGMGCRKSLWENVRSVHQLDPHKELLKFYDRYYSANVMSLAVLGKENLDQMAEMVVPLFAQVPNKNLERPHWSEHPYCADQLATKVHYVPVKDLRKLNLLFPAFDLLPFYKSKPEQYVSHLLGHEGRGSLLFELKRRGWANELSAEAQSMPHGFDTVNVEIELSPEGLSNVDEIVRLFFQYARLTLQKVQPQKWIYDEVAKLSDIHFRFADKKKPDEYVTSLATVLHDYPINEVLYAPCHMMTDFNEEIISKLVDVLHPRNVIVVVCSKDFEGKTDLSDEWYGLKYSVSKLDPSFISHCESNLNCEPISGATKMVTENRSSLNPHFTLPDKNEFIPSKFDIYYPKTASPASEISRPPVILNNDPMSRLWCKQDDEFLMPKCCVFVQIRSPLAYDDPAHFVACYLMSDLLKDALTDYAYDAHLAGLSYGLYNTEYGLSFKLEGYDEKQAAFLSKIFGEMCRFELDAQRFAVLKERYVRYLRDFEKKQPYKQIRHYSALLLTEKIWSNSEILNEAERITLDQVKEFRSRFFNSIHIETFIHGNTTNEVSKDLAEVVKTCLKQCVDIKPLFSSQFRQNRTIRLPEGKSYRFEMKNDTHVNSSVAVFFQTNLENSLQNMLTELTHQVLRESFFDQLRTKEQLGYITSTNIRNYNGVRGLFFLIQGTKSPCFLESRIEAFIKNFEADLEEMSEEDFEEHKESLAVIRLEKPKTLNELGDKFWAEITVNQYHFTRDTAEVEVLRKITKEELTNFFKDYISASGSKRKKLSIYVYSADKWSEKEQNHSEMNGTSDETATVTLIDNIASFKSSLPLYELAKPYMDVPTAGVEDSKL